MSNNMMIKSNIILKKKAKDIISTNILKYLNLLILINIIFVDYIHNFINSINSCANTHDKLFSKYLDKVYKINHKYNDSYDHVTLQFFGGGWDVNLIQCDIRGPLCYILGYDLYQTNTSITHKYTLFLLFLCDKSFHNKIIGISNIDINNINEFDTQYHKYIFICYTLHKIVIFLYSQTIQKKKLDNLKIFKHNIFLISNINYSNDITNNLIIRDFIKKKIYPNKPDRFNENDFKYYDNLINNGYYHKSFIGINPYTNRKITIGGKIHNNLKYELKFHFFENIKQIKDRDEYLYNS
jgi:hypothetical protein